MWGAPGALPPEETVTWRIQGARTWSAHGEKLQLHREVVTEWGTGASRTKTQQYYLHHQELP